MADNDVSKNYALNIEVGVDASSLESLKNVKKSIEEIAGQVTVPNNASSINEHNIDQYFDYQKKISGQKPAKQVVEKSGVRQPIKIVEQQQDKSKYIANQDRIIEELKQIRESLVRGGHNHASNISSAQYVASGDIARQISAQVISAFNQAIKNIADSDWSFMSSNKNDTNQGVVSSNTVDNTATKKVKATTGKNISVETGDLPEGVSAAYDHKNQRIVVGGHLNGSQRSLATNHELIHPVQEFSAATNNNYLAKTKANNKRFIRNSAESVNEFLTNTMALTETALQSNGDSGAIKGAIEKYKETVFGRSGVIIKNLKSFTKMIERISSLNVSPETLLSNIGSDVKSLNSGSGTVVSRAAAEANYHVNSDGTIRDKSGKTVSDKRLMELRDDSGRRINQQDIASHNMAYYISGSAGAIGGVQDIGGRKRFLDGAAREFLNHRSVGIQFYSPERLSATNTEMMNSPSWSDVQKRMFDAMRRTHFRGSFSYNGTTDSGGSTLSTRERYPDKVKYGLKTNLERLAFAVGDDRTLSGLPKNMKNVSQEELMKYLTGFIFNGTGHTENDITSQNNALSENYGSAIETLRTAVGKWIESGNQNSDITFRGSNKQNQELADVVSIAKTIKGGVARGHVRPDIKRIYEESLQSAIGGKVGDAKTLEDVIAADSGDGETPLTAAQQAIRIISERVKPLFQKSGMNAGGRELAEFINEIKKVEDIGTVNQVGGITVTKKELESLKRLVDIASGKSGAGGENSSYEFGQEDIGRTLPIMGSIFENKAGAYNLAVGNIDSLSMTTGAPVDFLQRIVKNKSNLGHFNENGEVNPRYGFLRSALTDEGFNRMSQLERPVYDIMSSSQSIAGGFSEREKASSVVKNILKKYLHQGYRGADTQTTTEESFIKDFSSELSRSGISRGLNNSDISKISKLYKQVVDFNQRSLVANIQQRTDNLSYMDSRPQQPTKVATETASQDVRNGIVKYDYEKDNFVITNGERLLSGLKRSKRGRYTADKVSDTKLSAKELEQYKFISDISMANGDIATGESAIEKGDAYSGFTFINQRNPNRMLEKHRVRYDKDARVGEVDLGDVTRYVNRMVKEDNKDKNNEHYGEKGADKIHAMIKAIVERMAKDGGFDVAKIKYTYRGKEKTGYHALNQDAIKDLGIVPNDEFFNQNSSRERERQALFEKHRIGGIHQSSAADAPQDIVSSISQSIKTIIGRSISFKEIRNIAEDVRAIRRIIDGGSAQSPNISDNVSYMSSISPEEEKRRREELQKKMEAEGAFEYAKNNHEEPTRRTKSDKERLEEEEFKTNLASKQTKKEKLALLDERLAKMESDLKEAPEEDKNRRRAEIEKMRRKRIEIENSPGTKKDKIEFGKWREEKRLHNKEFIANLQGKGIEEISAAVGKEIKRLLNSGVNKTVGNYDKKAEIQRLVVELEKFRQSQAIKHDRATENSAILELQRRYKGQDSAFDATMKGASIDERPKKLKEEIDRVNESLDELKKKKEEALAGGNKKLAGFYETLAFHRETRKSVLEGKMNRAVDVKQQADKRAEERAVSDAQKTERARQGENSKLIRQHNAEGQQARSIFTKGIEYSAMAAMVYGVTKEVKEAISVMASFERQMVEVTRVMDPLYQSQDALSNSAKELAKKYGVSIIEAAKGMTVFAQQGKDMAQILQLTEASLLAANTTTMTAAQATEALTAAIRQFNLTDADAKSVIDSWLEVESRTAIQANTMADAMKISGTAARLAGLSFHEFNGIVSAVGSATRETGSQLGTAFKFIISKMRTEDAVNALQKLGVATHNQDGDFRDLMLILSDLNDKWKGMSNEQRAATAITIAGTRRYNTLMTLMERWDEALEAITMSEDSHGKAMRMNATIMDTYEKRVQKARASVESFYASMSKDTTKTLLGGIQKSIEKLAEFSEKWKLIGPLVQIGLTAGGLGLATRIGGSMGIGTALKDVVYKDTATKSVSEALENIRFNEKPFSERKIGLTEKASLWAKRMFSTEASGGRKEYLKRLGSYERVFQTNPLTGKEEYHNQERDELAGEIMKRSFGQLTKGTKTYHATLQKVQEQLDRQIDAQKEYISALENANPVIRGLRSFGNALEKNALKLVGFGLALTSISNMDYFKNSKSTTGKNIAGDIIGGVGALGSGMGAAGMALKLGGTLGVIGAALSALPTLIQVGEHIASAFEQFTGSDRIGSLNRQEESDRLKSLQGAVTKYKGFRDKEKRGELLSPEEREQKESAARIISMADPRSTKRGRRGLGSNIDEDRIDKLAGLKDDMENIRGRLNEDIAYNIMFVSDGGGSGNMIRQREKYKAAQAESEKAAAALEEFDRKHTGNLTESQLAKRSKLQERYSKSKQEEYKYEEELNATQSAFLSLVEEEALKYSDKRRRGDNSIVPSTRGSEKRREMFLGFRENFATKEDAMAKYARAVFAGQYQRSGGAPQNAAGAIKHFQETGELLTLTRGKDKNGKAVIILKREDAYGNKQEQSFEFNKFGASKDYVKEVANRIGVAEEALAHTSELSDALYRYNLKEIDKFADVSRKIGEVVYNSFKEELTKIDSLRTMVGKFSVSDIKDQYFGYQKQLVNLEKISDTFVKAFGTFDKHITDAILKNASSNDHENAASRATDISSKIAKDGSILGVGATALNSFVMAAQKSLMANEVIQSVLKARIKSDKDAEGSAEVLNTDIKRINEYLAGAGLSDTYASIVKRMGGASEQEIRSAIVEKVSAASELYSKKDIDSFVKSIQNLESSIDKLAEHIKDSSKTIELLRQRDLAMSGNGGVFNDKDIRDSYEYMDTTSIDTLAGITRGMLSQAKAAKDIAQESVKAAERARDEVYRSMGNRTDPDSAIAKKNADEGLRRQIMMSDKASERFDIIAQKAQAVEEMVKEVKATATKSYGDFKAMMRRLESDAIKWGRGEYYFGTNADNYTELSKLEAQKSFLENFRQFKSANMFALRNKAATVGLTNDEEIELSGIEKVLGEIDAKLAEVGQKQLDINSSILKVHAEAIKRNRQQQVEHFANKISRSKDTGRSQKSLFDANYQNTRDIFRSIVGTDFFQGLSTNSNLFQKVASLGQKMENMRDTADIAGNPAFNKQYLLASAQDKAIVDQIMYRKESGESLKQIFADAGLKEMARSNPIVGQLLDSLMQKEENERIIDINNKMYDVQQELLKILTQIANAPGRRNQRLEDYGRNAEVARRESEFMSIHLGLNKPGFAEGTTYTGAGGKYESAGLVEVHKGEGLGVLSQTAMARYPIMSRRVLKMISDMNEGTVPGFANGTRHHLQTNYIVGNTGSEDKNDTASIHGDIYKLIYLLRKRDTGMSNISRSVHMDLEGGIHKLLKAIDKLPDSRKISSEIDRLIKFAPLSGGRRRFHQNIGDANAEAVVSADGRSLSFKYGDKYDSLSQREKDMVRFHEQGGHGSIYQRNYMGRIVSNYGHAVPEFFSDMGAMAAGRMPFRSSAYQTEDSISLAKSARLSKKKTAVDAYISLQEEMIKNPKIIREQLAHIQTSDPNGGMSIGREQFLQGGRRGAIPFVSDAISRGDRESARKIYRNHRILTNAVFGNDDIYVEDFRDEINSGKIGMGRQYGGAVQSAGVDNKYYLGGVDKSSDAYVITQAVKNAKQRKGRAVAYDKAMSEISSRVKVLMTEGKPINYVVGDMKIPYTEKRMASEEFRQYYYDTQMSKNREASWRATIPGKNKTFMQDFKEKFHEYYRSPKIERAQGEKYFSVNGRSFFNRDELNAYIKNMAETISRNNPADVKLTAKEEFKAKYDALRNLRKENRVGGVTVRNGRIRSAYNPIEMLMQSSVADFFRAGGANRVGGEALDFIRHGLDATNSAVSGVYGKGIKPAASWMANKSIAAYNKSIRPVADVALKYYERIRPAVSMVTGGISDFYNRTVSPVSRAVRDAVGRVVGEAKHGSQFIYDKGAAAYGSARRTLSNIGAKIGGIEIPFTESVMVREYAKNNDVFGIDAAKSSANRRMTIGELGQRISSKIDATSIGRGVRDTFKYGYDVSKPIVKNFSNPMRLAMAKNAYESGARAIELYRKNDIMGSIEEGLQSVGSAYYAMPDKIPQLPASISSKLSRFNTKLTRVPVKAVSTASKFVGKAAPFAFAASGALEFGEGIFKGDNNKIASGTVGLANAAIYSKPMQSLMVNPRVLGKNMFSLGRRAVSGGGQLGLGMGLELGGSLISSLGEKYDIKALQHMGKYSGLAGNILSELSLPGMISKVFSGGVDLARLMFDKDYNKKYFDSRAHVGTSGVMMEKMVDIIPGLNAMLKIAGMDAKKALDEAEKNYKEAEERDKKLTDAARDRNYRVRQIKYHDNELGDNATAMEKAGQVQRVFTDIQTKGISGQLNGPDAQLAVIESIFRNENAIQLSERYGLDEKVKETDKILAQIERYESMNSNGKYDKEILALRKKLQTVFNILEEQKKNTIDAAQDWFYNQTGISTGIFDKGGVFEEIYNDELKAKQKELSERLEGVYKDNRGMFSFSSYEEMSRAAESGNEKAKRELEAFNKLVSKSDTLDKDVKELNKAILDLTQKIASIQNGTANQDLKTKWLKNDYGSLITKAHTAKKDNFEVIDRKLREEEKKLRLMILNSTKDEVDRQREKVESLRGELKMLSFDRTVKGKMKQTPESAQKELAKFIATRDAARAALSSEEITKTMAEFERAGSYVLKVGDEKLIVKDKDELRNLADRDNTTTTVKQKAVQQANEEYDRLFSEELILDQISSDFSKEYTELNRRKSAGTLSEDDKKRLDYFFKYYKDKEFREAEKKKELEKRKKKAEEEKKPTFAIKKAIEHARLSVEEVKRLEEDNDNAIENLEMEDNLTPEQEKELKDRYEIRNNIKKAKNARKTSLRSLKDEARAWALDRMNGRSEDEDVLAMNAAAFKLKRKKELEAKRKSGILSYGQKGRGGLSQEEWEEYKKLGSLDEVQKDYDKKYGDVVSKNVEIGHEFGPKTDFSEAGLQKYYRKHFKYGALPAGVTYGQRYNPKTGTYELTVPGMVNSVMPTKEQRLEAHAAEAEKTAAQNGKQQAGQQAGQGNGQQNGQNKQTTAQNGEQQAGQPGQQQGHGNGQQNGQNKQTAQNGKQQAGQQTGQGNRQQDNNTAKISSDTTAMSTDLKQIKENLDRLVKMFIVYSDAILRMKNDFPSVGAIRKQSGTKFDEVVESLN